jgi:hypothetical protein
VNPASPLAFYGLPLLALIGAVIAVLVVWGLSKAIGADAWSTVCRFLRPPGALGRGLLPLLLALAVVAFFATDQLGPTLQVASGVFLAALGTRAHVRTQRLPVTLRDSPAKR